jgi:DNA-binding HxlR family transcriptional regulator
MLPNSYGKQDCSLARALEIVGERWTLLVLRDAFYGVRRFNDFLAHLDMPRTVLSNRLRSLIERGLLVKVPDAGHSGRWLYELTDEGMALWPALYALRSWGERQSGRQPRMFTHDACDTPLDATGRCETCGVLPARPIRSSCHRWVNPGREGGPILWPLRCGASTACLISCQ